MRLVIQRAAQASVTVDGKLVSEIGRGLFILVGVEVGDTEDDMKCSLVNDGPVTIIIDSKLKE